MMAEAADIDDSITGNAYASVSLNHPPVHPGCYLPPTNWRGSKSTGSNFSQVVKQSSWWPSDKISGGNIKGS